MSDVRIICRLIAALLALGASAAAETAETPQRAAAAKALAEVSAYASSILMNDDGSGRSDYNLVASEWLIYETHWHTGQLIYGLVEAGAVLDAPGLIAAARRAGDWWAGTEFREPHPFAGLVNAKHGDRLGRLINWTTISDGAPGLFRLSEATGDAKYADAATRSGVWLWDNTRVPDTVKGGEGLFYNLFDPKTGVVLTDWNAHVRGGERDAARVAAEGPSPVEEVARPNIEGFLFADMCAHLDEKVWCDRFLEQASHALARQDDNGLWMDFEPNDRKSGRVHPRFNIWNAEALLKAFEISGERKYLEGAAKTARFYRDAATKDGAIFYRTFVDQPAARTGVTGSAVAFNGVLMLGLRRHGLDEFDDAIKTAVDWILANRFSTDHPDPNLAGAVVNTRLKVRKSGVRYINRDVGSTFAMRFLADYLRSDLAERSRPGGALNRTHGGIGGNDDGR
ncbi:MAG: hypothetical protein ACFB00_08035 [Parvularculaceae bacterium]